MKRRFRKKIVLIVIFMILLGLKKSNAVETSTLPSSFDLRDEITIKVENQGNLGTCWTFAALNSLETYLSLNGYGEYDFSEIHLACMEKGFDQETDEIDSADFEYGGFFEDFIHYSFSQQGPVLESEIPYYKNNVWGTNYTENDLQFFKTAEKYGYIYEYKTFGETLNYQGDKIKLRRDVKNHLMNNGSIYTSILGNFYLSLNSDMKNGKFEYVVNNTSPNSDHAITIIGWDDNYPKEYFPEDIRPSCDGAYIALNSWGESWGDNGIFYISYEDSNVERYMYGITSASINLDKSQLKEVHIEDKNVYESLKKQIEYYIADDETQVFYLAESQITSVYGLDLSGIDVSTTKGLEIFKNCAMYNFSNCNIDDLSVLDSLKDIVYSLDLPKNNLTDISNISEFSNLSSLDLSENKNIKDLSPITELQSLYWLKLNDCELTDVSGLAKITASNVDFNMDSVQVELNNNNITDISVLENANIQILMLNGNKSITKIGNLKNVTNLELSNCDIEDISFLSNLNNVAILNLDNNKIKDISILDSLNNLTECSIKNQIITDNIAITDNSKDFIYSMPTIISTSKNYDEYLTPTSWDLFGNPIRDGEFQSIVSEGAILSNDYSSIIISEKSANGNVTLTVNGGVADGTVYNINYTIDDNNSNEQDDSKDENKEDISNEEQNNGDANNEKNEQNEENRETGEIDKTEQSGEEDKKENSEEDKTEIDKIGKTEQSDKTAVDNGEKAEKSGESEKTEETDKIEKTENSDKAEVGENEKTEESNNEVSEKIKENDNKENIKNTNNSINTGDSIAIYIGIISLAIVILIAIFIKKEIAKNCEKK